MAAEKRVAEIVYLDPRRAPSGAFAEEFARLRNTPCIEDEQSKDESAGLAVAPQKSAYDVKITAAPQCEKPAPKRRPMKLVEPERVHVRQMQLGLQCLYDCAIELEAEIEKIGKSMQVTDAQVSQGSLGYTAVCMDVDAVMRELTSKVRAFKNSAYAAKAKLSAFKL